MTAYKVRKKLPCTKNLVKLGKISKKLLKDKFYSSAFRPRVAIYEN